MQGITSLMSPDDKEWFQVYGKASLPTSWQHLHPDFRINLHSGRRTKDLIDKTIGQLRRHNQTPNKVIQQTLSANPKGWTDILDAMSSTFYLKGEGASTEDDTKWVLGMLCRQWFGNNGQLDKDIGDKFFGDIRTYLNDNPHNKDLDQVLGLKAWRREHKSPITIPDYVFRVMRLVIFGDDRRDLQDKQEPIVLDKACKIVHEELCDKWEEEGGYITKKVRGKKKEVSIINEDWKNLKKGEYSGWIEANLDGVTIPVTSKVTIEKTFNKFKYHALNEYMFHYAIIMRNPHFLEGEPKKLIASKYWKIQLPERLEVLSSPNEDQECSESNQEVCVHTS